MKAGTLKLTKAQAKIACGAFLHGEVVVNGRSWPAVKVLVQNGIASERYLYRSGASAGLGGRDEITVRLTETGKRLIKAACEAV